MKDLDILIVIIILGLFFFLIVGGSIFFVIDYILEPSDDEKCQSIGMSRYKYIMNAQYCIDYNNEAHFVDFKCEGLFKNKVCTAEIISIGDIRVR